MADLSYDERCDILGLWLAIRAKVVDMRPEHAAMPCSHPNYALSTLAIESLRGHLDRLPREHPWLREVLEALHAGVRT